MLGFLESGVSDHPACRTRIEQGVALPFDEMNFTGLARKRRPAEPHFRAEMENTESRWFSCSSPSYSATREEIEDENEQEVEED